MLKLARTPSRRQTKSDPVQRAGGSFKRFVLIAAAAAVLVAAVVISVVRDTGLRSAIFYGLDVPSQDSRLIDTATRETGVRPSMQNIFIKLYSASFGIDTLQGIDSGGMVPMITLEPWAVASKWTGNPQPQYRLSVLSSGRYDSEFSHIADVIRSFGKPVYLRFAHEMNGRWYPWAESVNGNKPGDYVAAWRHVAGIFRRLSPNASLVWSPNAIHAGDASLAELFPGDKYVDEVGMTAYGHGGSASHTMDATYQELVRLSRRPVILTEVGVDGHAKAKWIADFGRFVASHDRIVGFVWFNTSPATTGATGDYRFDDSAADISAFTKMLASQKLASRQSIAPRALYATS